MNGLQGPLWQSSVAVHCESSDATRLRLLCPGQSAATAPAPSAFCSVTLPLPPSTRGIALGAVAMEDYDNSAPAMRTVPLSCKGTLDSSIALDIRSASVNFEIKNVVRPIPGDVFFADGGNKSEMRRVLSRGAPWRFAWRLLVKVFVVSLCP